MAHLVLRQAGGQQGREGDAAEATPPPPLGGHGVALYVARQDDPARHRGTVVLLHESAFAPPPDAVRDHRLGRLSAAAFRSTYLDHLQALWRQDPAAFPRLIALASGESGLIALTSGKGFPCSSRREEAPLERVEPGAAVALALDELYIG